MYPVAGAGAAAPPPYQQQVSYPGAQQQPPYGPQYPAAAVAPAPYAQQPYPTGQQQPPYAQQYPAAAPMTTAQPPAPYQVSVAFHAPPLGQASPAVAPPPAYTAPAPQAEALPVKSEITQSSLSFPSVPLFVPLPQLNSGQMINIRGNILPNPNIPKFFINLLLGTLGTGDIALHLSARFKEKSVVRNNLNGKKWGKEERSGSGFPFTPGAPFDVTILIMQDAYKIAIDGKHYCEFKHRACFENVRYLQVEGDVSLTSVNVPLVKTKSLMALPHEQQIVSGLKAGQVFYISGVTNSPSYDRFQIDFLEADHAIAFHFNARFHEKAVVRNRMTTGLYGGWGSEERSQPFYPFLPGQPFDVVIMVDKTQFRIEINGQHFCLFEHRQKNLQKIKALRITGDVKLHSLVM